MFKKILYNTIWQIVGKGITASTTLLITLIIGRALGPAGFGEFTKIFVFVGYFYALADFGLNSIFIKSTQSTPEAKKSLHLQGEGSMFKVLLGLRLLISISLAIFATLIALFLPYNPDLNTGFSPLVKTGMIIASLTIITQALFNTSNALFQKNLRYDLSALSTVFGSITIVVITFILSLTTKSILPYVFIYVVGGTIYVLASFSLVFTKLKISLSPRFDFEKSKPLLSQSWPIGIALVLNLLYFRIDILILSGFRQSSEVGLYGLGYQFFQTALAIPIFFTNALFPILVKVFKENIEKFQKMVKAWSIYLVSFSIILTIVLFLISYLIPLIYDLRFSGSGTALRILALGMPFFFISALFWHLLIIYGKQKLLIYIYSIGAIFNLITNIIFIPTYGFLAAATTTIISEALVTALLLIGVIRSKN